MRTQTVARLMYAVTGLNCLVAMAAFCWPRAVLPRLPLADCYDVVVAAPELTQDAQAATDRWSLTTPACFTVVPGPCRPDAVCVPSVEPVPERFASRLDSTQTIGYQLGQAMGVPDDPPDDVATAGELEQWQVSEWYRVRSVSHKRMW